jgi:hypothetical protein
MRKMSIAPANAIGMLRDQEAKAALRVALSCAVRVLAATSYLRRNDRRYSHPSQANGQ